MKADEQEPDCSTKLTELMMAQYNRKATKDRIDCVKFAMSSKVNVWYVKIHNFSGDENEFVGAEFICKLVTKEGFPNEPPSFCFLTPNGIFDPMKDVCVSIGKYHKDNWRSTLGMSGLVLNLMSAFVGWRVLGKGIGIESGISIDNIRKCSADSKRYNREKYAAIDDMIEAAYAEYSKKWPAVKTPANEAK